MIIIRVIIFQVIVIRVIMFQVIIVQVITLLKFIKRREKCNCKAFCNWNLKKSPCVPKGMMPKLQLPKQRKLKSNEKICLRQNFWFFWKWTEKNYEKKPNQQKKTNNKNWKVATKVDRRTFLLRFDFRFFVESNKFYFGQKVKRKPNFRFEYFAPSKIQHTV